MPAKKKTSIKKPAKAAAKKSATKRGPGHPKKAAKRK
jgi:hypothetical protein